MDVVTIRNPPTQDQLVGRHRIHQSSLQSLLASRIMEHRVQRPPIPILEQVVGDRV